MIEPHIFGPFVKMVEKLPAKAIIPGLELECRMVRNDLECNRYSLTAEAQSLLYFREFVQSAKFGGTMHFVSPFPPEEVEFYRNILVRLVEANELAPETLKKFDRICSSVDLSLAA
jgi:hypothetical protein